MKIKINAVQTIIAIAISALFAYGFYSFHLFSDTKILLSAGSFLFLAATLTLAIGTRFQQPRTTANIRVVAGIFFVVAFVSNLSFLFMRFSTPTYIIINGILLLIFVSITYTIGKANQ